MDKLFRIHMPIRAKYGVARLPGGPLSVGLPMTGHLQNWVPIYFNLGEGGFSDYQGNSSVFKMCSLKMKTILDENKGPCDEIQWLTTYVKDEHREEREYYILHFPEEYDTIDWNKSRLHKNKPGGVIAPVFSRKKIEEKHRVFNYPDSGGLAIVITEDIKKKLEKANCTGIVFSKAPLVD
jgi:hypothetical protein